MGGVEIPNPDVPEPTRPDPATASSTPAQPPNGPSKTPMEVPKVARNVRLVGLSYAHVARNGPSLAQDGTKVVPSGWRSKGGQLVTRKQVNRRTATGSPHNY